MTKRSMNLAQFRLTMGREESDNLEGGHIQPTFGRFPSIEKGGHLHLTAEAPDPLKK